MATTIKTITMISFNMQRIILLLSLPFLILYSIADAEESATPVTSITPTSSSSAIPIDTVVAIVEHEVIMQSDLDRASAYARAQLAARGAPVPPDDVLTKQVLENLILESLQLQFATRAKISVSDDALNAQMEKIAAQNNMSLNQFSEALKREGTTYPAVKEQVRKEMILSQLRQKVIAQRVRVSQSEIDRSLGKTSNEAEFHLATIVISPNAKTSEGIASAQQTAQEVYSLAKKGRSFAQLAAAHSAASNAKTGGDMGWRKSSQLPSSISSVINSLSVGDVSPPVRDGSSFVIVKLIDKRGGDNAGSTTVATEYHTRHILITPSKIRSEAKAQQLINEIKVQIDQGVDFGKLAKKYSDDPSSASLGGDLGWSTSQKFVSEFGARMENLPVGSVSDPFQTKFGWHILEVLEKRETNQAEEKEKEQVVSKIKKQKYDDELQMWLRQLRQEAFVEIKI